MGLQSKQKLKQLGFANLKALPVQVQITYNRLDGSKYVRIITEVKRTTKRMEEATATANFGLLANHCEQATARLARKGDYESARANARGYANFMSSYNSTPQQQATTVHMLSGLNEIDTMLHDQLQSETALSEESKSFNGFGASSTRNRRKMRKAARSSNDRLASRLQSKAKAKRSAYSRYSS